METLRTLLQYCFMSRPSPTQQRKPPSRTAAAIMETIIPVFKLP